MDSVGEGKGGMISENSTETCILPYVKQMTIASSMHEAGHPSWCSGTIQRDKVGREVGGEFRWGDTCMPVTIHVDVWQKPSQYCKVLILQLK